VKQASTSSNESEQGPARSSFWRELTGVLAGGLVVLAVFVLVVEIIAWSRGEQGLGVPSLIGHIVAAVLAVLAQRFADRGSGRIPMIAGCVVVVITVVALWLLWWL
jgi:lipopolysaccharide export LptBFGC system permease protein LptF